MTEKQYVNHGTATLSGELEEGGPYTIHGVALGAGDVTKGASGVKKLWPPEELKDAAETLSGTPLVKNHTNTVEGVIGEVKKAKYKEGVGVLYEAEVDEQYKELAEKIANNRLDVSVRAYHAPVEELDEDDETGAKVVKDVKFDNLSVVPTGAAPSNSAQAGAATEMSASELREFFDADGADGADSDVEEAGPASVDVVEEDGSGLVNDVSWYEEDNDVRVWTADIDAEDLSPEEAKRSVRSVLAEYHDVDEEAILMMSASDSKVDYQIDGSAEGAEELADWSFHTPDWSGTTTGEWSQPDMKDFDTDDLGEIADHFLLSKSGFEDPDAYTDLSCPVVEPDGELSLGGLRSAIGGHGIQSVDGVSDSMLTKVENWIIDTVEEEFDKKWDGDSDENSAFGANTSDATETATSEQPAEEAGKSTLAGASIWSDDPTYDSDSTRVLELESFSGGFDADNLGDNSMTDIESKVEEMSEPVVIEQDDLSELEEKAEQFETVDGRLEELGDTLDELSEAKGLIEDAGRENVEALRDAEEPRVVEDEDYEALTEEIEKIKGLYAEELAEHTPMEQEMLEGKFSVYELRDMMDETEEAELAASEDEPDPKGGQTSEEELEDTEEEIESEEKEAELREQYAEHYEDLGWDSTAQKVRDGDLSLEEMGADL